MKHYYENDKLTHMGPMDAVVWTRFLRENKEKYYNYQYDVRVGTAIELPQNAPSWLVRSSQALSRKRIDVVMEDSENIYIVEVRPRFTNEALGRILTYTLLYLRDEKPPKNLVPMVVYERADVDMTTVAEMHGVRTVQI